jgi:hypothetical protein
MIITMSVRPVRGGGQAPTKGNCFKDWLNVVVNVLAQTRQNFCGALGLSLRGGNISMTIMNHDLAGIVVDAGLVIVAVVISDKDTMVE